MEQSRSAASTSMFIFAMGLYSFAALASAQQPGQGTFSSAEEASRPISRQLRVTTRKPC